MSGKKSKGHAKAHLFGGDWTVQKLDVLAAYLRKYTTALKDKPTAADPFSKVFIDAFAGTGYREARVDNDEASSSESLVFPDLAAEEPQRLLAGSAKLALETGPPFDRYIFIERSAARCASLEELKIEFPNQAHRIAVEHGEANEKIRALCVDGPEWRSRRAVLFLDPYGMQVEWKTIEAVAATKAIDLWLLFPLGIGVNRLLTRSGEIPDAWRKRLDLILGTEDWYQEFYRTETSFDLFGQPHETIIKQKMETIGRYFNDRLKRVFAGVVEEPGVLRNSSGTPLYLLCFAVGNERGKPIALRIAGHLLKKLR